MKVVICERIDESGINLLREEDVEIELLYETNRPIEDVMREADGVLVRLTRMTEPLLKLGKANRLKVVSKHGIGVDNIDLEAAKRLGIRVVNTPGVMADAVAEFTVGSILLFAKNYMKYDSEVRRGRWSVRYDASSMEIKGKTLGLIGYGRIGSRVAKLANQFGMTIVAYDPYAKVEDDYVKQIGLDALLKVSDFISIHVPLTKETYHMIGRKEIEIAKEGLYLINTARGSIIDQEELCLALKKGKVAGAVLDTTEQEPITLENPVLSCKNVFLTAHTAGTTDAAQVKMSRLACEQLLQVLNDETPPHVLV